VVLFSINISCREDECGGCRKGEHVGKGTVVAAGKANLVETEYA